jgi:hypothetical protein
MLLPFQHWGQRIRDAGCSISALEELSQSFRNSSFESKSKSSGR